MDSKGAGVLDSFVGALAGAIVDVGRAGLHVLGPDNFEYYMCSLSLRNRNMEEVAYMSFPVMPNNIMESQQAVASVTKTNKGIVTQFNSSFNPKDISIQGTFGRKLRLILGNKEFAPVDAAAGFAMAQKFFNGNIGINGGIAGTDILIKTGNGVYGELRDMIVYRKGDNEKYLCKVAKVFEVSNEDFLRGALADELVEQSQFVGGCQSDDIEDGATEMTPVQRDTWFTVCAAIVNKDNGKWFLMDPEGYEYARYIFLPLDWLNMYEKEVKHIMAQEDLEKNYDYHLPNCYK